MIRDKLIEKFGEDILLNSCLWFPEGERELRELLSDLKLDKIMEIGTMYGLSAAVLSEYCNKIYTYDIEDHKQKYEVWDFLGCKNIIFNPRGRIRYDLAFIDGEHWKGQIVKDYHRCRSAKYIVFHDYNDVHTEVRNFVDALTGEKIINGDFVLYKGDHNG